jgi:hypothetical protein
MKYELYVLQRFLTFQLHVASANGYLRVVEFLLDNHVATDMQDKDCWQPIHAAACWGHVSHIYFSNRFSIQCQILNTIYIYFISILMKLFLSLSDGQSLLLTLLGFAIAKACAIRHVNGEFNEYKVCSNRPNSRLQVGTPIVREIGFQINAAVSCCCSI